MRSADEVDVHVGSRLRRRRTALGISQEQLGVALGLTFQQIQKYEKGQNRIGAGRLYRISTILSVPVQYFFDGITNGAEAPSLLNEQVSDREIEAFILSPEGKALSAGFLRVADPATRRDIVELVTSLARDRARAKAGSRIDHHGSACQTPGTVRDHSPKEPRCRGKTISLPRNRCPRGILTRCATRFRIQ